MTKTRYKATNHGFSMVEIMMVLLVSMIVTGFAVPTIRSVLSLYRLRSAVSNVTWAVQSTRYQALMQGYPFQVTFSSPGGGASPIYQIASKPIGAGSFSDVGTSVPLSGSPVTLSATTVLQFKPNGSVTATTGALNFNVAYSGITKTVTVSNYGNIAVTP